MEEQQPTTNNKEKTWFEATYEELESILWSVMCSQDELSAQLASYMEKLTELEKTEQSIVVGEGLEKLTDARHLVNKTKTKLDSVVTRLERLLLLTSVPSVSKRE